MKNISAAKNEMPQRGERLSNMELLRLVAMMLVLITHACFLATGVPSEQDAMARPLSTMTRFGFMSLSCVCVNVFVLLSGWFGMHTSLRKVWTFLFQVFFFALLVYAVMICWFPEHYLNLKSLGTILMLNSSDYWFAKAYLGLMMVAPMLNVWTERAGERGMLAFLLAFYVFQTVYGWASLYGAEWLGGGYSAFSFIGLYVLARYFRLYGQQRVEGVISLLVHKEVKIGAVFYFVVYFALSLLLALVAFGVTRMGLPVAGRLFTYTQPLVVVGALCLLLAFSKMSFQSRIINAVAVSCFAIYLLHGNELLLRAHYGKIIRQWFVRCDTLTFAVYTVLFISAWFIAAVLIDRIRILLWNGIEHIFYRK